LRVLPDIGDEVATSIAAFFEQEGNQRVVDALLASRYCFQRRGRAVAKSCVTAGLDVLLDRPSVSKLGPKEHATTRRALSDTRRS
jgi:DNA ligase (NAD+)